MNLRRLVVASGSAVVVAALLVVVMFKLVDREWEEPVTEEPTVFPIFNEPSKDPPPPEPDPLVRPTEQTPPPDIPVDPPVVPGDDDPVIGEQTPPPPPPGNDIGVANGGPFPLVRVEPVYPPDAARRKVEGWVIVEFTIAENGSVQEPVVIEAEPSGIFNRAAQRAVAKWKYQPSVVDGKPVAMSGVRTQLTFKLSQ